jgi:peptide chain release factor subunit 1
MHPATDLSDHLDRLAGYEPTRLPFVSLYLNAQPDEHGRDRFGAFLRKELNERALTYGDDAEARDSLRRDLERIETYLAEEVQPSANGVAIFTSSGAGFFDAIQVAAPIDGHRLFVSDRPHLYPLARLDSRYPRYAALLCDTNHARLFVFAGGGIEKIGEVAGTKTRHHDMGGWSQARYQRHVENIHLHHVKEVVDQLARLVREEDISRVILAANDVALPMIQDQLPKALRDRVIDVMKLDVDAPEREVLERTLDALHRKGAESDREKVDAAIGAHRAGGLGVVGIEATWQALENGQVDELLISAALVEAPAVHGAAPAPAEAHNGAHGTEHSESRVDAMIARARQTDARITFIEDPALLAKVGGVAARLRYPSASAAARSAARST